MRRSDTTIIAAANSEVITDDMIKELMIQEYKKRPLSQITDMLKLLYQNEFGCGHMVTDEANSLSMIREEARTLQDKALTGDVHEYIGDGLCRLYLRVLRHSTLKPDTLNRFFSITANQARGSIGSYERKTMAFVQLCKDGVLPFDAAEVSRILTEHRSAGYPVFRHSQQYRLEYAPAYRVVDKVFCDLLSLFCGIDELTQKQERVIIAIDGGSAAGKSTLATMLDAVYSCNVFSMDDFFLRPVQRTPDRLNEPGGNIDYERFSEEVLNPLKTGRPFSYRPYNCSEQKLLGDVAVDPCQINIVEGVYSLHLRFIEAYDLKVFLNIEQTEQNRRLIERDKELYSRFIQEWIPMEKRYFDTFQVRSKCHLTFELARKDGTA